MMEKTHELASRVLRGARNLTLRPLKRLFVSSIFALAGLSACRGSVDSNRIRDTGFIEFTVGQCYRIVTADRTYQPLNLARDFEVEGLQVRFEAIPKPTFNTCLAGEVVELTKIERLISGPNAQAEVGAEINARGHGE